MNLPNCTTKSLYTWPTSNFPRETPTGSREDSCENVARAQQEQVLHRGHLRRDPSTPTFHGYTGGINTRVSAKKNETVLTIDPGTKTLVKQNKAE